MSALHHRRARIARVRRAQHLLAAADAARADAQVDRLEGTAAHLARLAQALAHTPGPASAQQLGNAAELAGRLDGLRHGMSDGIAAARAAAADQTARRLAARIAQEGADRLHDQAATAAAIAQDRRLAGVPRPRASERA